MKLSRQRHANQLSADCSLDSATDDTSTAITSKNNKNKNKKEGDNMEEYDSAISKLQDMMDKAIDSLKESTKEIKIGNISKRIHYYQDKLESLKDTLEDIENNESKKRRLLKRKDETQEELKKLKMRMSELE